MAMGRHRTRAAGLGRPRKHKNELAVKIKLKAPPTPENLRRLIAKRSGDMTVANAVEYIAKTIDIIIQKLAFDNSPQTMAQALNGLIDMITKADQILGSHRFKARILTSQQINQLLSGKYSVEAPGFAEYIYVNIIKIYRELSDAETELDVVALLGMLANLTVELQCVLKGYSGGCIVYGKKIKPACEWQSKFIFFD